MKSRQGLCGALVAAAVIMLGVTSAGAQTLFSYENGEAGFPYVGNPGLYTVSTSNVGVTNGVQSLQVSVPVPTFGGPQSSFLTDAVRAAAINAAPAVLIDMTLPNVTFGFGNIDLTF